MDSEISAAPVAVFAYNRLDKIKKCLEYLEKCEMSDISDIYIFADGYRSEKDRKSVEDVQEWLKKYCSGTTDLNCKRGSGFKETHLELKEKNEGLANSIISGVTNLIGKYGKVIVVEDDILVSGFFLRYMNLALNYYQKNSRIWAIASYGYNLKALKNYPHDVYLEYRASSWGWATWNDRWHTVDWEVKDFAELEKDKRLQAKFCRGGGDLFPMLQRQMRGESDSWAIRWNYAASKQNRLTVYPKVGFVSNIGFDGSGSHTGDRGIDAKYFENFDSTQDVYLKFEDIQLNQKIVREFYILHTDTLGKKVKRNLSPKKFVAMIKRKLTRR